MQNMAFWLVSQEFLKSIYRILVLILSTYLEQIKGFIAIPSENNTCFHISFIKHSKLFHSFFKKKAVNLSVNFNFMVSPIFVRCESKTI